MEDLEFFNKQIDKTLIDRLKALGDASFKIISQADCIKILQQSKKKFENKPEYMFDLATEHER